MTLAQAANLLDARLEGDDRVFHSVATDSRRLEAGALFVALRGERFDGHDYIDAAIDRGAAGVLSERPTRTGVPTIRVADTLDALQRLAAHWRRRFACPLVAVTGSNGKTTVKEMIGSILSKVGPTLVSAGNLNNHIGVPLSLLRLDHSHRFAVIEMGMNHAGELARLTALAAPDVALVNNAAPAHLEGLGSVERVAAAKGEIFGGLAEGGIAVINADDAFAGFWLDLNRSRRALTFGFDADADVRGAARTYTDHSLLDIRSGDVRLSARIPVGGAHNARNALAAAAVAIALKVPAAAITAGLEAFTPVAGRGAVAALAGGATLIDDSYNANPGSMAAAIDLLSRHPGRRILVIGDMGELGPEADRLHREAGRAAQAAGIECMYGFGPRSALTCAAFGPAARAFDDIDDLIDALLEEIDAGVTVLVKGSRSMRMERVSNALVGRFSVAERS